MHRRCDEQRGVAHGSVEPDVARRRAALRARRRFALRQREGQKADGIDPLLLLDQQIEVGVGRQLVVHELLRAGRQLDLGANLAGALGGDFLQRADRHASTSGRP